VLISDGASQVISSYLPDDDEHVEWAKIDTDRDLGNIGYTGAIASASNASAKTAETAAERAEMKAWFDANEIVGNGADIETETKSGSEDSFATVKNDYLRLGYSGQVILDGSECDVIFDDDDDDNTYQTEYGPDDLPPYLKDVVIVFPKQSQETYETTPAFGKDLVTVPEDVTVGDYYTGIETVYQPVLTHIDRADNLLYKTDAASGRTASGSYDAIKYGFYINEPVTIQKKVDIDSTFSIHEDEDGSDEMGFRDTVTDTQLTDTPYNDARLLNITQLKLDESYWLTFEDEVADSDEYDAEDLAESIDGKYLHFPFDVVLYRTHGGASYPEYFRCAEQEVDTLGGDITGKNEDGGQYWIELYEDEWNEIEFYIPPWATEKIYDSSAYGQQIQYRIDTVNDEDEISKDIHQIGCQISGWLYDFEILAVNDPMSFDPDEDKPEVNSWYSFYINGEEKKTGTQNRLGYNSEHNDINQYVRTGITGEVTDNWDSTDSVVLANGKSSKYADLGMLSKGTSFTFSVKTISNLWHNQDYLKVTPSFTFIDSDGTPYSEDQFTIYYNDYSGNAAGILKKADDAENVVSLSDEGFGGAFTRDDLKFKAQTLNVDSTAVGGESGSYRVSLSNMTDSELETAASKLLETKASISSFSEFYLTDALKIYNGDVKYLSTNLYLDEEDVDLIDDLVPVPTEDGNLITEDDVVSETERRNNMLKICMQQWFGKYTIPDELYVTTSSEEEIREYANTHGGITKDDPVFEQGGYLILNLDFVSVKDGSEDLCFAGNGLNLDMWESQNQDKTAKLGGQEIHVGSGDVAVIDLNSRVSDHYETNFFTIH
ncbi:MAG: hypothetical protein LUE86_08320, partial [Clostridiales bacterium]|nr:hypothetical protein [Clostridiales bacterium]